MTRTSVLRLTAAAAAAMTLLPALPASASVMSGHGRPEAPGSRGIGYACPADDVDGVDFADAQGSVHADAVRCLAWYGVTKGAADGTFGAGKAVTRAQMATFLAGVLEQAGVTLPTQAANAFSDDEGDVHEANLDKLAALGIVTGTGGGAVTPHATVHRDQMASFLFRVLELIGDDELTAGYQDYFEDTAGSVHRGPINALARLGITAGKSKQLFDPAGEVQREQMATFLMRLLDRLVQRGEATGPVRLTLSQHEVAPGDVVEATVRGRGVTSVELVGCGFDGAVTDADPKKKGVQLSLTVPDAWPTDEGATATATSSGTVGEPDSECELAVVVSLDNGRIVTLEAELEYADGNEAEDESEDADENEAEDESQDGSDNEHEGDDASGTEHEDDGSMR